MSHQCFNSNNSFLYTLIELYWELCRGAIQRAAKLLLTLPATKCKLQQSLQQHVIWTAPLLFTYLKISHIFRSQGPKQSQRTEQTKYVPWLHHIVHTHHSLFPCKKQNYFIKRKRLFFPLIALSLPFHVCKQLLLLLKDTWFRYFL